MLIAQKEELLICLKITLRLKDVEVSLVGQGLVRAGILPVRRDSVGCPTDGLGVSMSFARWLFSILPCSRS